MKHVQTVIKGVSVLGRNIGAAFLLGVVTIMCANVAYRAIGGIIPGTFDLVELLIIPAIGFALVTVELQRRHTVVDMITTHLPVRLRSCLEIVVVGNQSPLLGRALLGRLEDVAEKDGDRRNDPASPGVSHALQDRLGLHPGLDMCRHSVESPDDDQRDRGEEMSPELIGVLGFATLFVFLASGMPIGVGMGIVGALGLCMTLSVPAAITKMATAPFELVSNYTFASLPLFLLMGHAIFSSGQGGSMFKSASKWFGRVPGGLAMATVAACALFGAVSASSVATAVTMGLVALPEMKKRNYDAALATGVVAAGGTIGSLIPPSSYLLIYGILTENSIAKLFAGGVIPGIIVSASYVIAIGVRCWKKPALGPHAGRYSIKEKIASLKDIWEIMALGVFAIGGLIVGLFTATEAGAVGAGGAFLSAAIRRKLTWKSFSEAVLDTMTTTGMIYAILIGAFIFNYFCAASRLPTVLAQWVAGMALPPEGIMVVVIVIYLVLGCLMDAPSIQMLTTPIFYPVVMSLGFDPIWFGVIQCRLLEVGLITPPMGMNVYVVAGLDKSIPMTTVFRGISWFLIMDVVTLAMFVVWPRIITFLPSLMK